MDIKYFKIQGLALLSPKIFNDDRGFFLETFRESTYQKILGVEFVQDNMSYSVYGTVRGLHFQTSPYAQAKLVRCARGRILDVAVDLRRDSESFGSWIGVELDGQAQQQFFLPAGFAHGFAVLSQEALVEYKCDAYYEPLADAGLRFDDPDLGIDWRVPRADMKVSAKDSSLPYWKDLFNKGIS